MKYFSPTHRKNISISKQGHTVTEETREKISIKRKGVKAWNKGLKGFRLGEKRPDIVPKGSQSVCWKGEKVSYRGLHMWVELNLGKPIYCENCGLDYIPKGKKRYFQWANKSGEYLRDLNDWLRLCAKCHKIYDKR